MKTKHIFFLLTGILLVSIAACDDDDKNEQLENPYREELIGNWKLMEITTTHYASSPEVRETKTVSHADDSIIYDFRADNRLIITGSAKNDSLPEQGEYTYNYKPFTRSLTHDYFVTANLQIEDDEQVCVCKKEDNEMTITSEVILNMVVSESGVIFSSEKITQNRKFVKVQ